MKRRARFELLALAMNVSALGGVLLAIRLAGLGDRLWPAAAFLTVGAAASTAVEASVRLLRRRARRQADDVVPHGVRLGKPVWMSAIDPLTVLAGGAPIGAVAAAAGVPGVGVGILLTVVAIQVGVEYASSIASPTALTFEPGGLRVHIRGATFLIPWNAITGVSREGPEGRRLTCVRILETTSIIASVRPDTPRTRTRVWMAVADGDQPTGKLTLLPWTAGLDAPIMARAIATALDGQPGRAN